MNAAVSSKPREAPVTVVVSRRVKPGREQAYEEWVHGVVQVAMGYEGHLGSNVFRPSDPEHPDYVLVFQFNSQANLDRWIQSEDRKAWLAKVEPLVEGPMKADVLTGLENWFTLPSHRHAPASPPPRHKMAMVTWLAIFPLINVLGAGLAPVLSPLPPLLRSAVMSALMVTLMTYVVMPRLTRLFARFLFPKPAR
jgi:hypothetical protein